MKTQEESRPRRFDSMLPVPISTFVLISEGLQGVEGWVVKISHIQALVSVERVLVRSDWQNYPGILVAAPLDLHVAADHLRTLPDGLYVHGIPVTVTKLAGQWTSQISGVGAVLVPFKGEALALLDEQDRWFVPRWTVRRVRPGGIGA